MRRTAKINEDSEGLFSVRTYGERAVRTVIVIDCLREHRLRLTPQGRSLFIEEGKRVIRFPHTAEKGPVKPAFIPVADPGGTVRRDTVLGNGPPLPIVEGECGIVLPVNSESGPAYTLLTPEADEDFPFGIDAVFRNRPSGTVIKGKRAVTVYIHAETGPERSGLIPETHPDDAVWCYTVLGNRIPLIIIKGERAVTVFEYPETGTVETVFVPETDPGRAVRPRAEFGNDPPLPVDDLEALGPDHLFPKLSKSNLRVENKSRQCSSGKCREHGGNEQFSELFPVHGNPLKAFHTTLPFHYSPATGME